MLGNSVSSLFIGDSINVFILETENANKRYSCKACVISYRRIGDLRYHIKRKHLKEKFIQCRHCDDRFMTYHERNLHSTTEHLGEKPSYICDLCTRSFKRKNTLSSHMLDVHIEKKCSQCDLYFVRTKVLFHLNEAHGVDMPTCGVCGYRTLRPSLLVQHQRKVHLNEKNISCKICNKGFYMQSNLLDHMITHEQLKVHKCDVCAKSFARKECYKAHYRIHTGERPYSCGLCKATFVQRASLRFHMRKQHPGTAK
jgi:uncharacterized Zn-finger protein